MLHQLVNSQYLLGQENAWHWENLLKEVANDILYDDDYDGDYDYQTMIMK